MRPYYEHAGITIYHGDCREILPQLPKGWCDRCNEALPDEEILSIHLAGCGKVRPYYEALVSDPPYGIALEHHNLNDARAPKFRSIYGDEDRLIGAWLCDWSHLNGTPIILFASPWKPWPGEWRHLLVWDKGPAVGGGGDTATCFKRTWELIQATRTPALQVPRGESVLRYWVGPQDSALHVAQKPLDLMAYLITALTLPGQSIVDPCCGSGSTLEAAKKCGHSAIGIEIEEKYCEIAAKRLSQEVFDFGLRG